MGVGTGLATCVGLGVGVTIGLGVGLITCVGGGEGLDCTAVDDEPQATSRLLKKAKQTSMSVTFVRVPRRMRPSGAYNARDISYGISILF